MKYYVTALVALTIWLSVPVVLGQSQVVIEPDAQLEIEVNFNKHGQRGLALTLSEAPNVPAERLRAGALSWAFLPEDVWVEGQAAARTHAFNYFFGFTNDPDNQLIDDGKFVPDEPARIVIFGWTCASGDCSRESDMTDFHFVTDEPLNYHVLESAEVLGNDRQAREVEVVPEPEPAVEAVPEVEPESEVESPLVEEAPEVVEPEPEPEIEATPEVEPEPEAEPPLVEGEEESNDEAEDQEGTASSSDSVAD